MSDDTIEDLFVSLRVLAKLKPNDRISTSNRNIRIESQTNAWAHYFVGVIRKIRGETREVNIDRVRQILNAMLVHVDSAVDLLAMLQSNKNAHWRCVEKKAFIKRAMRALTQAVSGLENLTLTYRDDDTIEARIDEACLCVRTRVQHIERQLAPIFASMGDDDDDVVDVDVNYGAGADNVMYRQPVRASKRSQERKHRERGVRGGGGGGGTHDTTGTDGDSEPETSALSMLRAQRGGGGSTSASVSPPYRSRQTNSDQEY